MNERIRQRSDPTIPNQRDGRVRLQGEAYLDNTDRGIYGHRAFVDGCQWPYPKTWFINGEVKLACPVAVLAWGMFK